MGARAERESIAGYPARHRHANPTKRPRGPDTIVVAKSRQNHRDEVQNKSVEGFQRRAGNIVRVKLAHESAEQILG
jgi:hypothetical protein